MSVRARLALVAVVLCLATPAFAQKELHWDEMAVKARLDADGVLHVEERQAIVFTGDWNGAERVFRLDADQELSLRSITRIDAASGARIMLQQGDLELVDHYDWVAPHTVRWRTRRVSDPRFDNTQIDYVLSYTLGNILQRSSGGYVLDHDFALADRAGIIRRFRLDLELDPVWKSKEAVPHGVLLKGLVPGEGHVVTLHLTHLGARRPASVPMVGRR